MQNEQTFRKIQEAFHIALSRRFLSGFLKVGDHGCWRIIVVYILSGFCKLHLDEG